MPINCPGGEKARFRVKKNEGGNVRLAFCGSKVVEATKLGEKAKKKGKLGA